MFAFCAVIAFIILDILGMAFLASLIEYWPYNLSLSLRNYNFDLMDGGGWAAYYNSIEMAAWTARFGTIIVFSGAYLVEKGRGFRLGRTLFHLLAIMPPAVPDSGRATCRERGCKYG